MDAASAPRSATLSRPILQQMFDCSNPAARISAMALVNLYADRGPHAIVYHDAQGLAANAFLTQVARSLEDQFPNTEVEMTTHCLLDEPGSYREVNLTRIPA